MVSLVLFAKNIIRRDTVSAATNVIYLNNLRIIPSFRKNLCKKTSLYTFSKGRKWGSTIRIVGINSIDFQTFLKILDYSVCDDFRKFQDERFRFLISLRYLLLWHFSWPILIEWIKSRCESVCDMHISYLRSNSGSWSS